MLELVGESGVCFKDGGEVGGEGRKRVVFVEVHKR